MRERWNGSIQSTNTPTINQSGAQREDFNLFRCMVTRVIYTDDSSNISKNATNPVVLYEVVILGGYKQGQTMFPCRIANYLGGNDNYSERTLTASSKDISKSPLQDHDGDIVYVQFNQGHSSYPVITSCDRGINDTSTGTTAAQGPRSLQQYNGVYEEINNKGEYTIKRKGGTLTDGRFKPASGIEGQLQFLKDSVKLTDDSSFLQFTKSTDDAMLKTKGGAEFHAKANKIALGAQGIELLDQLVQALEKIHMFIDPTDATHTHIGNLGYETLIPTQTSQFVSAANDIKAIKEKIAQIKGSL